MLSTSRWNTTPALCLLLAAPTPYFFAVPHMGCGDQSLRIPSIEAVYIRRGIHILATVDFAEAAPVILGISMSWTDTKTLRWSDGPERWLLIFKRLEEVIWTNLFLFAGHLEMTITTIISSQPRDSRILFAFCEEWNASINLLNPITCQKKVFLILSPMSH